MSIRNTQNNRTAQIQQLLGTEGNALGQGWPALNISADAVQDVPPVAFFRVKSYIIEKQEIAEEHLRGV